MLFDLFFDMNLIIIHNYVTKLFSRFEAVLAFHILELLLVAELYVQALRLNPVGPMFFPDFT